MKHTKDNNSAPRQFFGSVLVMTIIIASGIMVVSAEFALFVVGAIRQARTIDHSIIAYYAAESGIENGLFQIRAEGRTALRKEKSADEFPRGMSWTLANEGGVTRFRNSIDRLEKSLMKKNETTEFALYQKVQDEFEGIQGLEGLKITWQKEEQSCLDAGQRPWFEVSVIEWERGLVNWNNVSVKKEFLEPQGAAKQAVLDLSGVGQNITQYKPMLVRAKPLFCDVGGVAITLHTDGSATSAPTPIPNYFFLEPEGSFSAISQRTHAIFPAKESAMGLFDFALFSEEQVKKSN